MARRTEEQEQITKADRDFPYKPLISHRAWQILDEAISELESNDDLELHTDKKYVIGYLVQTLLEAGLLPPIIPEHLSERERKRYSWLLVYSGPVPAAERRSHIVK